MLQRIEDLAEWFEDQSFENSAAVSCRMALRGLLPLFTSADVMSRGARHFRAINLSLVSLVRPESQSALRPFLSKLRNSDSIMEANLAVGRVNYYESATARRQSRASSSANDFPQEVLRKSASMTVNKLLREKHRAETEVARAMGVLLADVLLEKRASANLIGLLNRAQSTPQRITLWDSISADCNYLEHGGNPESLFKVSLWENSQSLPSDPTEFDNAEKFWAYWYTGFWNGDPMDWDLLSEVALLETSHSDDSVDDLSIKIAQIELQWLQKLANYPEQIELSSKGLFTIAPGSISDPRRYKNALRKVKDDVDHIESIQKTNAYTGLSDIIEIIQRALTQHQNEPMAVHDDFLKSLKMIIRRIDRHELPPFDDLIDNLIDDLNTATIDIRATDAGVAEAVVSRARMKLRKPNPYEAQSLLGQIELKSKQSEPTLAAQLRADGQTISDFEPGQDSDVGSEPERAVQRIANRLPQMQTRSVQESGKSKVDRTVDAADKAAKLQKGAKAIGSAADQGWGWLQYLLSLF